MATLYGLMVVSMKCVAAKREKLNLQLLCRSMPMCSMESC